VEHLMPREKSGFSWRE